MTRIAINGLGRIGKLVLRDLIDHGANGDIVLIYEPNADAEPVSYTHQTLPPPPYV